MFTSELKGWEVKGDMGREGILRPKELGKRGRVMGSVKGMCQGAKVGNALVREQ